MQPVLRAGLFGFDKLIAGGFDTSTKLSADRLTAGGFDKLTTGGFDTSTKLSADRLTAGG